MPQHERAATLLLLFGLAFVSSARLPPSRPGGATPRSLAPRDDDDDSELISRVVDARVKTLADEHTVAALSDMSTSEYSNRTKPSNYTDLLAMPQQMLRRTLMHLKKQHPSLFLLVASAVVQHSRARADKSSSVKQLRSLIELGDDFHIAIVTTAALPWMTGTAVNPLLRAAHLAKAGKRVTLMVPWLHPVDQAMVFPDGLRFTSPAEQTEYIGHWLRTRGGLPSDLFRLTFYPGRYDAERGSILPLGDITRFFTPEESDLCVLEEPEHLTWYHNGPNWRHRFKLVVGVVHTNYLFYAKTWENGGPLAANTLSAINSIMCQAYCDKVIKLSDALQPLPRAVTCNVHGVRADFLDIGRRAARRPQWRRGAYFLGKALWAKGHRLLLGYLALQRERREPPSQIDIFGHGEDLGAIMAEAARMGASMSFHGPTDHAGERLREYKVFVNPSQSEVLSTTTAEALAIGKYVVLERHPSNAFFEPFRNALYYETPSEFLLQLRYALATEPAPLSDEEQRTLSWEGATERFLDAVTNSTLGDTLPTLSDSSAEWLHQALQESGLGDAVRKMSGGGPVARQAWLKSPLLRDADVTEIVEQSLVHSPPGSSSSET